MKIRIQPSEIEVPRDDPFRHDLLGRKEPVEILTQLVGGFEGPCVLAIDAGWGTGKTTFFRMWAQHLRNGGFPVVEFNAWENDFSGEPFVALSTELTERLDEYTDTDETLATKIAKTKKVAIEVLRRAFPGAIRLATAGFLDLTQLTEKELGQVLGSFAKDKLSEYLKAQKSIKAFKHTLQDLAKTLAKSGETPPLIIMIDELDRCRPSYAVELLEVAKHFFSVDHIVFVLAVNRSELVHSIKSLYGRGFDAAGYLRRFFDVDFRLPEPERKAFIDAVLNTIQIDRYFTRTKDGDARQEYADVKELIHGFFGGSELSLRRIAQAIHRLGLVLASLRSDQRSFALTAVVASILRTIDRDLYDRFHSGKASDLEVVENVFVPSGAISVVKDETRYTFERMIVLAAREVSNSADSPLLKRYESLLEDLDETDARSQNPEQKRAKHIVDWVEWSQGARPATIGFRVSVQRIELIHSGLIGQ